jgi:hypothetical protein
VGDAAFARVPSRGGSFIRSCAGSGSRYLKFCLL